MERRFLDFILRTEEVQKRCMAYVRRVPFRMDGGKNAQRHKCHYDNNGNYLPCFQGLRHDLVVVFQKCDFYIVTLFSLPLIFDHGFSAFHFTSDI